MRLAHVAKLSKQDDIECDPVHFSGPCAG